MLSPPSASAEARRCIAPKAAYTPPPYGQAFTLWVGAQTAPPGSLRYVRSHRRVCEEKRGAYGSTSTDGWTLCLRGREEGDRRCVSPFVQEVLRVEAGLTPPTAGGVCLFTCSCGHVFGITITYENNCCCQACIKRPRRPLFFPVVHFLDLMLPEGSAKNPYLYTPPSPRAKRPHLYMTPVHRRGHS